MPEPVFEAQGLSVYYQSGRDTVYGARELDFDVAAGEWVCLIGHSGCGKSSVLMGSLGLRGRISGSLRLASENITPDYPERKWRELRGARVSLIPQSPQSALNPMLAVSRQFENLLKSHERLTGAQCRERTLALLDGAELKADVAEKYPHELSGGMCQRVLIAMAVAFGPRLILADEPTSALDALTQKQILRLLRLKREECGAAVLMSTHNLSLARALADRVVIMHEGRIVEQGPADEVFSSPSAEYTRLLVSEL